MRGWHRSLSVALQEVTWLHALPVDVRLRVELDMVEAWYRAGEVVAHRGEPAESWIGVAEGLLKVCSAFRNGKVVMFAAIPVGGWIGEGSVMKQELRRYEIVALRDCRVIHLPASTFRWLQESSLEFNQVLAERLNARLSQYIGMVEIDRLGDPVARVARCIATLFDPVLCPRPDLCLKLTQFELSEFVGLSRTTISFGLRQLAHEGLLSTRYGTIAVQDLTALQNYEGSDSRRPLRQELNLGRDVDKR